jgi:two-component system, response regulator YesN
VIKVLIVDDEKLVRKGIIALLPWEKFHMVVSGEASNGQKALEFLEQNEVDLVMTDLSMPVLSGFELMREIQQNYPEVCTVVLTCHQDFGYIQDALRAGAIDYIVKTQLEKETLEVVLERIARRVDCENRKRSKTMGSASEDSELELNISREIRIKYSEEIIKSIGKSIRYIKKNLSEGISQDEIAKEIGMSRGYFSQCFKDIVGKPFGEYAREVKLGKAKELLTQTNKPVYWIADQLGFQDEKYFSKLFREYTGQLPTEFRSSAFKRN